MPIIAREPSHSFDCNLMVDPLAQCSCYLSRNNKHDPNCSSLTKVLLTHPPQSGKCDCSLSRGASKEDPYGRKQPEPLPAHVERMQEELKELVPRLNNLAGFMLTKTFHQLSVVEQERLIQQREPMEEYARILSLRYFSALLEHEG